MNMNSDMIFANAVLVSAMVTQHCEAKGKASAIVARPLEIVGTFSQDQGGAFVSTGPPRSPGAPHCGVIDFDDRQD